MKHVQREETVRRAAAAVAGSLNASILLFSDKNTNQKCVGKANNKLLAPEKVVSKELKQLSTRAQKGRGRKHLMA